MATQDERAIEPEANPVIRLVRRLVPVTNAYHGQHFFVREHSRWTATPLFIVLVFDRGHRSRIRRRLYPCDLCCDTGPVFGLYIERIRNTWVEIVIFPAGGCGRPFPFLKLGLAAVLGFVGGKCCWRMFSNSYRRIPGRDCSACGRVDCGIVDVPPRIGGAYPCPAPSWGSDYGKETAPVETPD